MDIQDKIINKLIEHDEQLALIREHMVTKDDLRQVTNILEGIATSVKRIEDDHTMTIEWVTRVQERVEAHDRDINKIKLQLHIA